MSWRPIVKVAGESQWVGNGLRFATREEAAESAAELAGRWLLVREDSCEESPDPVNYAWRDGRAVEL